MELLSYDEVTEGKTPPADWIYFIHGIYGAGRNWATVARRLVRERSGTGAMLIDLREHGTSQGFAGPHTIEACARDMDALAAATHPPNGIVAHSFGGKVALRYTRDFHPPSLMHVWVVDSTPAPREPSGSAWGMLEKLRAVPESFSSRTEAVSALEAQGVPNPVAQWMSTNLRSEGNQYVWRIDFDVMQTLLEDFFREDLWDVVENPPPNVHVHFIHASQSSVLDAEARERISRAAERTQRVTLDTVEGGHWLNADNPDALVELLLRDLGTT